MLFLSLSEPGSNQSNVVHIPPTIVRHSAFYSIFNKYVDREQDCILFLFLSCTYLIKLLSICHDAIAYRGFLIYNFEFQN